MKGNADAIREQYLRFIDESLLNVVEKGKAAGLTLEDLHKKLEGAFYGQCS